MSIHPVILSSSLPHTHCLKGHPGDAWSEGTLFLSISRHWREKSGEKCFSMEMIIVALELSQCTQIFLKRERQAKFIKHVRSVRGMVHICSQS